MNQQFYEATEIVPMGEIPDTVRAEITGKTEAEADEILAQVKSIMVGLNYRLVKHICNHLEGMPCVSQEIQ
jgi:hypothetical protein